MFVHCEQSAQKPYNAGLDTASTIQLIGYNSFQGIKTSTEYLVTLVNMCLPIEGPATSRFMLSEANNDCCSNTRTGMAGRRVQYGVVNAADADVGAGAPDFGATWQSKDNLRQQIIKMSDVPANAKLYFWDGQLWLRWDDPDDLPGPTTHKDCLSRHHRYDTPFLGSAGSRQAYAQ